MEVKLKDKEQTIRELRAKTSKVVYKPLRKYEKEKKDLLAQLREKDEKIESLQKQLGVKVASKPKEVKKETTRKSKSYQLELDKKQLESIIASHEDQIKKLNEELRRKDSAYSELYNKLREKEAQIAAGRGDCAQELKFKDEEIKRLQAVIKSTIERIELLSSPSKLPVNEE